MCGWLVRTLLPSSPYPKLTSLVSVKRLSCIWYPWRPFSVLGLAMDLHSSVASLCVVVCCLVCFYILCVEEHATGRLKWTSDLSNLNPFRASWRPRSYHTFSSCYLSWVAWNIVRRCCCKEACNVCSTEKIFHTIWLAAVHAMEEKSSYLVLWTWAFLQSASPILKSETYTLSLS